MPATAIKPPAKTVAKAPAPAPAPAPENTPSPIETFVPESFAMPDDDGDVTAPINPTPAPEPTPSPTPNPAPIPPNPPTDLSQMTPEQRKKHNADLRVQLEESNRRAKEMEDRLAAVEKEKQDRIAAIEKERDEINGRLTETSTRFAELNRTLSMENPAQSEEVQQIVAPWNARVESITKDISDTGGNGKAFRNMLPELVNAYKAIGPEDSEGYAQRREAYNAMVQQFPDHAKEVRELIRNGIEIQGRAAQVMRDMQNNGETFRYQRERKMWDAVAQDFAKDEAKYFAPSPEVKEADPFNAEVLVTELLSGSDEGKKRMDVIKKFARFTLLPMPPVNPEDLAKMTNEEAANFFESRQQQYQVNQLKLRRLLPTALAAQALLPGLVKRNQELEEQIATLRGVAPPPKGGASTPKVNADQIDDVRNFTPSNTVLEHLDDE